MLKRGVTANSHRHLGEAATEENTLGRELNPNTEKGAGKEGEEEREEQGKMEGSRKRRGTGREEALLHY